MTLAELSRRWDRFWFEPISPVTVSVFRMVFGLLVLEWCALLAPDLLTWFGERGVLSSATAARVVVQPWINVFRFLPTGDGWVVALFALLALGAVCLTLGLLTRTSSLLVFLLLVSFQHRNSLIFNSGDVLLRLMAFYLIFSPAGKCFSLDRLIAIRRGRIRPDQPPAKFSPWAQRLMQLQMVAIYFQSCWSKSNGGMWMEGTAVYYVLREHQFLRFPVPQMAGELWLSKLLTWGALALEYSLWTLIWFKETRYWVLAGGVLLHLGIDWSLNLPVFQYAMIAGLLTFVEPDDLMSAINFVSKRIYGRKARAAI